MGFLSRLSNVFDAAVYAFSPERGAKRIATRMLFDSQVERYGKYQGRALEAAESTRLRDGRWMTSRLSTDSFLEMDLESTRSRSRELTRNDFVGGAIDSRVEHTVGTGFTVQAKVRAVDGLISEDEARRIDEQLERLFEQVEPTACRTRRKSLWDKVSLAARLLDTDGEAFVVFSDVGSTDAPIPLCVEVIDADRVETPPDKEANKLVRMGIQYKPSGEIDGYWVRKSHPYDSKDFRAGYDFFPASRVRHLFVEWFSGQSRGLPWMTRSLNRAKDGKDLQEAGIIGAQVEACFAGFVKSKTNPLAKAMGATTTTESTFRIQEVRPGSLNYLGADDDVTFATPSKSNAVGTLMEYNNRTIAAGLNWPYEMLMKDWRGVSFAGGRIILNAAKISTRVRQRMIIDGMLVPFWNRMVDEAVVLGEVDIDPRVYRENLYAFRRHKWAAPKWSYAITPGEEVNAVVTAIDNNLMTLADALSEGQQDFEEVVEQRAKERAAERENGIIPSDRAAAEKTAQPSPQDVQQTQEAAS